MAESLMRTRENSPETAMPLRVTVAPNGARRGHADHHQLPISLDEILHTVRTCWAVGAHEVHLHVRDAQGKHSLSPDIYRETIGAIRAHVPDIAIQITTESTGVYDVSAQFDLLRQLRPDAASIAIRESMRAPELVKPLYAFAADAGIRVQHILYDLDDLKQLRQQLDKGAIPDHMRDVLLVFGAYSPPRLAQPTEVAPFVHALDQDFPNWTVCAFGQHEIAVAAEAIRLGGHIRIGFENNIQRPDGSPAKDNAENIALALKTAQALQRPIQSRPV